MGRIMAIVLLCMSLLLQGWMVDSVPYDNTASLECMDNPMGPLYTGGIIQNSEFNNGLTGWSVPPGVQAFIGTSPSGNKFAVSRSNGAKPSRSVFHNIQMQSHNHYALSAWFQVSNRQQVVVKATIKAPNGAYMAAGAILVNPGCWTMLKGGITADSSGPAELFFEVDDAAVDIMVDSVSLQPFSFHEWSAQRSHSTDRARRSSVKVVVTQDDAQGRKPLANATVNMVLSKPGFPFGNAMTSEILDIPAYEKWFTSRFTVATFENEMKWYSTEGVPNHEDYAVPDAMLRLAERHGIKVRGHNVFWDDPKTQMEWVKHLSPDQLTVAMRRRLHSLVTRYAGKVIAWDVVNENLHWDFFESKLGPNASAQIYQQVGSLDGTAALFMNEYGTLEGPLDTAAIATKYAAKMEQIRAYPGNAGLKLAVGLEGHFGSRPNIPYMRATLDTLAQLGVPIWLTEIDVAPGPTQTSSLEEVLREGYAHPNVQGIVMWAAWHARGCYVMCLTDNDFRNLPVGDVVDKLIAEWRADTLTATTDANGVIEVDLVHGEYNFTVTTHPSSSHNEPAVHAVTVDVSSTMRQQNIDIIV